MNTELDQWFVREILPHESALMRYLSRKLQPSAEVADLRQDTYVRVYENAARAFPRSPKTFLFATAHNLIVDRIRRERTASIAYAREPDAHDCRVDELTPEKTRSEKVDHTPIVTASDLVTDVILDAMRSVSETVHD